MQLKQSCLILGAALIFSDQRFKDILPSFLSKASQILEILFSTMFSKSNSNILEKYRNFYFNLAYQSTKQILALNNSNQPSLVSNFISDLSCLSTNPENISLEDTINKR
jgi:hypothetical protein